MPKRIDLIGQRFERLVVISRAPQLKPGSARWFCRCDCGNMHESNSQALRCGDCKSCGCWNDEVRRRQCIERGTHGQARRGARTRTYRIWVNMLARCHNPKGAAFDKYGARGIFVCDRWRAAFENFVADMGSCPVGLTIDRIDNAKGYEPGNCRWATMKTQQNNRTNNADLTLDGATLNISQWAERLGITRHTIRKRLNKGWPIERVLSAERYGRSGYEAGPIRS